MENKNYIFTQKQREYLKSCAFITLIVLLCLWFFQAGYVRGAAWMYANLTRMPQLDLTWVK